MASLSDVLSLARKVRNAFEEIGENKRLGGFCARASIQLHLAAERMGIRGVDICIGQGHVYCMYNDTVIDVTATQFGIEDEVFTSKILDLKETVNKDGVRRHSSWEQLNRFHDLADGYKVAKRIGSWANWWVCDKQTIADDMHYVLKHTGELITDSIDEATV